ncbi:RNA polymerase sigma factor [Hymenobacter sp. 15J16-1T3B]|uniref:RNA polymerase sigma factor n=1 Tax=Hymenobacter sp. 15J16-1T3B TaxID=2886941 RepID=UPI001D1271A0|nr:RNA polymerase sigma factor [Hymenobacter sp. 15J16-1T3B]MCC3159632.1 RNA polymerase sigma factor [Hymenobacter sp. 15J16-1T3B]
MPPVSIDELVEQCRQGRSSAQQALYERLGGRLFGVCLRYCPNREEAEEVLQNVFVKIFTRIHQFTGQGPFEAWARRIAVNTALHAWRQRQEPGLHVSWDDAPPVAETNGDALDHLSMTELLALVGTLPEGCRMVLNLYAVEGYAHAEIAEMLGISEGTSKSQLSRARKLLEARLTARQRIQCS